MGSKGPEWSQTEGVPILAAFPPSLTFSSWWTTQVSFCFKSSYMYISNKDHIVIQKLTTFTCLCVLWPRIMNVTCKAALNHLRNIGEIRHYLNRKSTEQLVHAIVLSKLDINNSLLYGLPDSLVLKRQCVQNVATHLVTRQAKHCYITILLTELHRLHVSQQIEFKVILMVFKALNDLAPEYIIIWIDYKEI